MNMNILEMSEELGNRDFINFLAYSHRLTQWRSDGGQKLLYIALSHESCDLDSVVSTLSIAYLRFRNPGIVKHKFLPVLNMMRRDYASKTEVRFLLDKQNIMPDSHLVFRDDVPEELMSRSRFLLVNHHVSPFHYCCEEVYDFRPYQCQAARLPIYCQRVMYPLNCCASIIAERYNSPIHNFARVRCLRICELLHAAILFQNNNFAGYLPESLPRVRDFQLLRSMESQLGKLNTKKRTKLYDSLVSAMFNLNDLTLPQILRRDFKLMCANNAKHFVRIANCCFPMAVTRFISFEFSEHALREFGDEHGLNFIVLLGTSTQPKGGLGIKEIGIIPLDALREVGDRQLFEHLIINLNASDCPLLMLEPYRRLDFMQGAFYFINVWNITFNCILTLMQRIVYNWVSQGKN